MSANSGCLAIVAVLLIILASLNLHRALLAAYNHASIVYPHYGFAGWMTPWQAAAGSIAVIAFGSYMLIAAYRKGR